MAQVFVTTSKNDYRWYSQRPRDPILPEVFLECDTNTDLWLPPEKHIREQKDEQDSFFYILSLLMACGRFDWRKNDAFTCTNNSYTDRPITKEEGIKLEHEFVENLKPIYERTYDKVLPPVPLGRKRIGYSRPSRMYTPFTSYQREYGTVAYKLLKQHYEESLAEMKATSEK